MQRKIKRLHLDSGMDSWIYCICMRVSLMFLKGTIIQVNALHSSSRHFEFGLFYNGKSAQSLCQVH